MLTKRFIWLAILAIPVFVGGLLYADGGITDWNNRNDSIVFVTDTTDTTNDRYVNDTGTIVLYDRAQDYGTLILRFIIDSSLEDAHGFGLADSCHIWFKTWTDGGFSKTLDSVKQAGLPCTLSVAYTGALGDTTLLQKFGVYYRIVDSTSDTTGITAAYAYDAQYLLRSK